VRYALIARHSTSTNEALAGATAAGVTWEPCRPRLRSRRSAQATPRSGVSTSSARSMVSRTVSRALGALAARGEAVLNKPAAQARAARRRRLIQKTRLSRCYTQARAAA
jgi:hypothetical protein